MIGLTGFDLNSGAEQLFFKFIPEESQNFIRYKSLIYPVHDN